MERFFMSSRLKQVSLIILLLLSLPVHSLCQAVPSYRREYFSVWADFDHDCINTRHETLIVQSVEAVLLSLDGCRVLNGKWLDPYTGLVFTEPSDVDVDHVVPLLWAWEHGAAFWSSEKLAAFGNDPLNLLVVDDATNASKGARGPLIWLPPNEKYHCSYIVRFMLVLKVYELEIGLEEGVNMYLLQEQLCSWKLFDLIDDLDLH